MRLPVFLFALIVTAVGGQARRSGNTTKLDAIQKYLDKLIPVVNDTILDQNSGPGISDVKSRPLSVYQGDTY